MKLQDIKKSVQKGFTMIELVIVIAILGILSAFALPRFASFSSDAKAANLSSIKGTINASMGILKAKFVAQGATGTTVDMNGYAIPVTTSGDIDFDVAAATDATCTNLINGLLSSTTGLNFGKYNGVTSTCLIFQRLPNGLGDTSTYLSFNKNGLN